MSLVQALDVQLIDLLPVVGVSVAIRGEAAPYRISERLHETMQKRAADEGVPVSTLLRLLREELNGQSVADPAEFLRQLQELGIHIEGRELLLELLATSSDWREELATLAKQGPKQGIVFHFASPAIEARETTLRIVELAETFSLKPHQRRFLVQNTIAPRPSK